jgi:quercetin dioxygenase-like cupin family protein
MDNLAFTFMLRELKIKIWNETPIHIQNSTAVFMCLEGTYRFHLQGRKIRERGTSVSRWLVPRSPVFLP